jgi:hypothetical protein
VDPGRQDDIAEGDVGGGEAARDADDQHEPGSEIIDQIAGGALRLAVALLDLAQDRQRVALAASKLAVAQGVLAAGALEHAGLRGTRRGLPGTRRRGSSGCRDFNNSIAVAPASH